MPLQHKNLTDSRLKVFTQHGVKPIKESGSSEVIADCLFCSGKEKLYINIDSKRWNCKICNRSGGFQKWLQAVSEYSQGEISAVQLTRLAKDRNLSIATLRRAQIGWNPWIQRYNLPIPMMDGPELADIRIYNIKTHKFISSADCKTGLFGWENLKSGASKVYLTEGEWDGLAMREALEAVNNQDEIVLSAPGAMTFKKEWISFFQGLTVHVLYDNDDPGKNGSIKILSMLQGIPKEIKFLHWKPNEKEGKDIGDVYAVLRKTPKAFFKRINLSLHDEPQEPKGKSPANLTVTSKISFKGPYIPVSQIYESYTKWLKLEDTTVLDILFGSAIANRIPGDPVWLLLVAQSGGVKSELIMSLDDVVNVVPRESITANTLISGMSLAGGGDPSLIPRLNNRILTIKDLTVLMEEKEPVRKAILSQLRNAYDGKAHKELGNSILRIYKSVFGIIAGVTPKIDIYAEGESAIGERFIRWRIPDALDEKLICKRSLRNTTNKQILRKELSQIAKAVLDYDFKNIPSMSETLEDKVISLAQWTAMLRGTVERDKYSKDIVQEPMKELATRLTNEYYKLVLGIGMLHQKSEISFSEYKSLKHVAISTIPAKSKSLFELMYNKGNVRGWKIRDMVPRLKFSQGTIQRLVEDLTVLGALRKVGIEKIHNEWTLSNKSLKLMEETGLWQ